MLSNAIKRLRHPSTRRGYIMIAFTLSLLMLLGVCGLAIDIGRLYLAKSEAQNFADIAALNAIASLAAAPTSFAAASAAAAQTNQKWHFGTTPFTDVVTTFGTSAADPSFTSTPPCCGHQLSDYRFALVTTRVNVPMYLIGLVTREEFGSVTASALGGQLLVTHLPGGEFPFSPYSRKTHSPDDPNDPFGFRVGNDYTLRWSPPGDKTSCGTDQGNVGSNGSFRGYCCTGGQSVPRLRDVLAGGGTVPVSVGDPFGPLEVNGQKNSIEIADWINADTDSLAPDYATYRSHSTGNGKRLVVVAVNDDRQTVVGFAAFFLYPANQYQGKNYCAEYVGSMVQGAPGLPPASGSGVRRMKLFR
jgi:Flp pilus assembly protein TadG